MKVLLINPPYSAEERYGKDLGRFGPLNEPLGLAYIAANLERAGHEVAILDAPALGIGSSEILSRMAGRGYGVVGVTMLTPMYARSTEVVRIIRKAYPGITIVVGGAHPTILPRETLLENPEIDFAVMGEGEGVMSTLAGALEAGKGTADIPGIAFRHDGEVSVNPPATPVADLDDLPMPSRHLLPMDAYHMTRSRSRSSHAFTVSVARGCPFDCAFCCRIFGRKVRHHSVGRILQEILVLVEKHGAKEINLEADTLTLNKTFLRSLCEGLLRSGLSERVIWTCESRVDTVDFELLKKMKEAGCWQVSYGVETGTQRLLDIIQKGITIEQIVKTFGLTKKVGIGIRAFYMLGLPTETREESLRTISFARKLDADWSQFTLFTPFPGTALYDLAVKEGVLRSHDWADFKTHGGWTKGGLAYIPKGRSLSEMKNLQKRAYRALYMQPKVFLRFLKKVDSLAKLRVYGEGLWVLIKTAFTSSEESVNKVIRIPKETLRRFAEEVYVDSPVYFAKNPLAREINWRKLDGAMELAPTESPSWILDFCCGNGILLPTLSGRFEKVAAMDLHTTAAARMRDSLSLGRIRLLRSDGAMLPFRENVFSLVFALSALEHFQDVSSAVTEIARVLKPGGFLIFLSPSENLFYRMGRRIFGYSKPPDHFHDARSIDSVLKKAFSFEEEKSFPERLPRFFSMYLLARYRKRNNEGVNSKQHYYPGFGRGRS